MQPLIIKQSRIISRTSFNFSGVIITDTQLMPLTTLDVVEGSRSFTVNFDLRMSVHSSSSILNPVGENHWRVVVFGNSNSNGLGQRTAEVESVVSSPLDARGATPSKHCRGFVVLFEQNWASLLCTWNSNVMLYCYNISKFGAYNIFFKDVFFFHLMVCKKKGGGREGGRNKSTELGYLSGMCLIKSRFEEKFLWNQLLPLISGVSVFSNRYYFF